MKREAHRATGEGVGWVEGCKLRAASQGHNHGGRKADAVGRRREGYSPPQTTRVMCFGELRWVIIKGKRAGRSTQTTCQPAANPHRTPITVPTVDTSRKRVLPFWPVRSEIGTHEIEQPTANWNRGTR